MAAPTLLDEPHGASRDDGALRILVIDDDEVDQVRVRRMLGKLPLPLPLPMTIGCGESLADARRCLGSSRVDVLLLDYMLPDGTAAEVLPQLVNDFPSLAIIVLTGQGDERVAVGLMQAGALDYLPKDGLTPVILQRSINHALALITEKMKAIKAAAALRDMMAVISHDLRGPLHNIALGLELAELPPALASSVKSNITHMGRLISDLVELARIENHALDLHREPTNLAHLVRTVGESFLPAAIAKEVKLEVRGGEDAHLQADPHRLSQALSNLIANAIKFTPAGGSVVVSVSNRTNAANACETEIAVTDTGPGIAAQERARVFQRYYTNDPKKMGIGLGLYIVKQIVSAHGGRIHVEPNLTADSKGSRFVIALPSTGAASAASTFG